MNGCLVEQDLCSADYRAAERYAKKTGAECMLRVFADGRLLMKDFRRDEIIETTVDDFLGYYDEDDCGCGHEHEHDHDCDCGCGHHHE